MLDRTYATHIRTLTRSLARLPSLRFEDAARESFELGGQAIRAILFDPLLPDPIVDASERQRFVATMRAYDEAGREVWMPFFRQAAEWAA